MMHRLDPTCDGAQALLIRHAKRDPIRKGDSVWVAALTAEGRADALSYGETLRSYRFGGAFASPIPRCMDTARLILDGWGYLTAPVTDERFLFSAYIADREPAAAEFTTSDPLQLILRQVAGEVLSGFLSLNEGSHLLLDEMQRRCTPGTVTLFVTHDALLMPFRAFFLGDTFSRNRWLPFLGNAAICFGDGKTHVDGREVRRFG